MGGQAFAAHFPTPRMSLAIYKHVLTQTQTILRTYYTNVSSAIEGPGKTTYGDVDVLVAGLLPHAFPPGISVAEKLKQALHAKACIQDKGNPTINFAVPWPREYEEAQIDGLESKAQIDTEDGLESKTQIPDNGTEEENKYVQVDVHISHGDLWNILGTTIRPYGLTVNNHGLYIRIPEIEMVERKKSMVFLTDDPVRVLDFLGLDEEKWWRRFGSQEEMFEYAGTCRMVWVKEEVDVVEGEGEEKGEKGEEKEKKKLKHNDRRRLAQRPIFKAWFEDFVPRCLKEGKYDIPRTTREQILTDAFEKFGIQEEYNTKLKEWSYTRHIDELTRDAIKNTIPVDGVDGQLRAAAIRILKGVILEGEKFEGKIPDAAEKDESGFYDLEVVKRFVGENWEEAGRVGMGRQLVRAREAMVKKAEKRKKEEELGDGIE
ncbi:hypothetical protein CJF30_00003782 [Rutstroemia sp. NJR-2017a BBW]|nr:hypothetical protein CJF30_00003782 [Rutstroemia sp. NJR-2017a BBW]